MKPFKYELGQKLFMMFYDKIVEVIVDGRSYSDSLKNVFGKKGVPIVEQYYSVRSYDFGRNSLKEDVLFETKEELCRVLCSK